MKLKKWKLEWKLLGGTILVVLIIFMILFNVTEPYIITKAANGVAEITFSWTKLWVWTSIAYIIFSYRFLNPVGTDENGVITFFKRPIGDDVGSGPVFAPLFLFDVRKETSLAIQKELPGEPEKIYRGDMKEKKELPKGMVPPIRIQFANSIPKKKAKVILGDDYIAKRQYGEEPNDETDKKIEFYPDTNPDDGLAKRVTAEPFPVVRFIIKDLSEFVRNIGSVKEAQKQIEDEIFAVLTRIYPKISVAQALQNIDWVNIHLYNAVEKRIGARGDLKPWGIALQDVFVKYIYTSHGVNTAISEAAAAPFKKQSVIVAAEASKQSKILNGEGDASAARALQKQTLDAQTEALKQRAEDLKITGEEAIAQFVAAELAKGDNSIILGSEGLGQMVALGSTLVNKNGNGGKK